MDTPFTTPFVNRRDWMAGAASAAIAAPLAVDAATAAANPAPVFGGPKIDFADPVQNLHALARLKNGARTVKRLKATWAPLLKKRPHEITLQMVDKLRDALGFNHVQVHVEPC